MPNNSLSDALKEVYSLAPNDRVELVGLVLSNPGLEESIFMVQDRDPWDFTLEDGVTVQTFEPVPFRFTPPAVGDNGLQEMSLAIDNAGDERIGDFFERVGESNAPVEVKVLVYLSDDPTTVQSNPPLVLFLTEIQIDAFQVTGRASFTNIVNFKFPTHHYDRQRFPGLA